MTKKRISVSGTTINKDTCFKERHLFTGWWWKGVFVFYALLCLCFSFSSISILFSYYRKKQMCKALYSVYIVLHFCVQHCY